MVHFQGYKIKSEQAAISPTTRLFLASDDRGKALLLKRYKKDGNAQGLVKFKQSLGLQQQLEINGLAKPIAIHEDQFFCYATFSAENCGNTLLALCEKNHVSLSTKLSISANIC